MTGQISSLKIQSRDSIAFNLLVNAKLINEKPSLFVFIDSIASGSKQIELQLANSRTKIQLEIKLEAQTAQVFDLVKIGEDYTLLPFSKTPISPSTGLTIEQEIANDSLAIDSSYFNYSGPKGCLRPVNDIYVTKLKEELNSEIFESSRRKKIEQSINSHCLSVDQFSIILSSIELEDYKLELANKAVSKLYDQNNFLQLESLFELKSSLESLQKIYQNEFIEN